MSGLLYGYRPTSVPRPQSHQIGVVHAERVSISIAIPDVRYRAGCGVSCFGAPLPAGTEITCQRCARWIERYGVQETPA
mgnify:CR=1 FL=1